MKQTFDEERLMVIKQSPRSADDVDVADLCDEIERLTRENDAKQAQIDSLMLEHCPEEMSQAQRPPGINDPAEIREALDICETAYHYLEIQVQCTCRRDYPYSGYITQQCRRCALMERWEDLMHTSDLATSRRAARLSYVP